MQNFDQLPCPVLVTDSTGLVQSINESLLELVGGIADTWIGKPMDGLFPIASRIFLQTHIWPMLMRESHVREIRLQILGIDKRMPVFVNCKQTTYNGIDSYVWVLFVTVERSLYEQELLIAKQRAEAVSAELVKSTRFIRTITDGLPSMIAYWDQEMLCQFANQACMDWFGRKPHEILGVSMSSLLGEKLFSLNLPFVQKALAGEEQEFERAIPKADGGVRYVLTHYLPDVDAYGTVKGVFALVTNITILRDADTAIRLSASVFDATMEGIMVTDVDANIVSVNPAFTKLTGYAPEEAVGKNARLLRSDRHDAAFFCNMYQELRTHKLWKGEVWSQRKNGSVFLERLSISAICDDQGEIIRYVGVCDDITDQWDKEQLMQKMALHDNLTGLPNRSLLMERLNQLISISLREPRHIALMFIDLDGFKLVNDTWGHAVGDEVLKTVSTRLLGIFRVSDTVVRLGGDEFVILLDNPTSRDSVTLLAERLISVVNAPINLEEKTVHVGTSIGIAFFPADGTSPDSLIKKADNAMYAAKVSGKNSYRFSA